MIAEREREREILNDKEEKSSRCIHKHTYIQLVLWPPYTLIFSVDFCSIQ